MGHVLNADREYRLLQRQMDHSVSCAPESPILTKILTLLFSPEDAQLARQIPTRPTALADLSRRLGISQDELADKMTDLAQRGLVIDVERKGQRYFALAPVLGGIFEFILMRVREDLPMAQLAALFDEYMNQDDRFARASFQGDTQFARAFVREEALPEAGHTEVLDWERVTRLVETASSLSLGLCACRHKNSHLGKACDAPVRTCISLNGGADAMIRMNISQPINADQALGVISACKGAGLAQLGDNVQRQVTFLCNCCGCCCTLINAIRAFEIRNAIVTSNWIMEVNPIRCKGCGQCAKACPVCAIAVTEESGVEKNHRHAALDDSLCLGCGVCYSMCKSGAIRMRSRPQRVFTPETTFDKTVRMAIERGRLADLLFENPERLSHRALGRILSVLEKSPPGKALMAVSPLRSVFLNAVLKRRPAPTT